MFAIEHRQGRSVVERDESEADRLEDAVDEAMIRALIFGADNVRILDPEGREVGVWPVEGQIDA